MTMTALLRVRDIASGGWMKMLVTGSERKGGVHGRLTWLPGKRVRTHLEAGVSHSDTYLLFTATLQGRLKGSGYMQNRRQLARKVPRQLGRLLWEEGWGFGAAAHCLHLFTTLWGQQWGLGLKPLKETLCLACVPMSTSPALKTCKLSMTSGSLP